MRRSREGGIALVAVLSVCGAALGAGAPEPAFRYSAPIEVKKTGPFVQLPLPVSAYGHAAQTELRDLRVVDARGERVPFAILGARSESQTREHAHDAALYPLPERPKADGTWQAPVEVVVDGDRVRVRKGGSRTAAGTAPPPRSAGWLVDLGERKREDPLPRGLRLQWSGPAEFSAGYRFETSDDLRAWRPGGSGQLMALAPLAPALGPLTQPDIALPEAPGRFVRLFWSDSATAPQITGAKVVVPERSEVALDAPSEIVLSPTAAPADPATTAAAAKGALYFDLGGTLPLAQVELRFATGTRVAPVRLQGRNLPEEAWSDLAQGVFYRLDRGGSVATSPPLALHRSVRFLRVVPDERAAVLVAAETRLAVQAQLASLVFAAQGEAPFALLAGAKDAAPGGLAATTLVPMLEDERARFGVAALGAWTEVAAVSRRLEAEQREAARRPVLLWSVLVAGVAALGFMVWRLARGSASAPAAKAGEGGAG